MKLKPDYKIFTFKRLPLFGDDDAGGAPRARRWAITALTIAVTFGWIFLLFFQL